MLIILEAWKLNVKAYKSNICLLLTLEQQWPFDIMLENSQTWPWTRIGSKLYLVKLDWWFQFAARSNLDCLVEYLFMYIWFRKAFHGSVSDQIQNFEPVKYLYFELSMSMKSAFFPHFPPHCHLPPPFSLSCHPWQTYSSSSSTLTPNLIPVFRQMWQRLNTWTAVIWGA